MLPIVGIKGLMAIIVPQVAPQKKQNKKQKLAGYLQWGRFICNGALGEPALLVGSRFGRFSGRDLRARRFPGSRPYCDKRSFRPGRAKR
jgi:hypothetical protein